MEVAARYKITCDEACRALWEIYDQLNGSDVCVAFPGVHLEECGVVIIADSAASTATLKAAKLILVTDGDGGYEAISKIAPILTSILVHVHGDNTWLEPLLGLLSRGRLVFTSQTVAPQGAGLLAPFGYTDGDRACLLAMSMGAKRVECPITHVVVHKGSLEYKIKKINMFRKLVGLYARRLGYECRGWITL
jgi:uncharacterized Rossmann fold enzyme